MGLFDGLRIAFIGANSLQTRQFFDELYCENMQQVIDADFRKGRLILRDGTIIYRIDTIESITGRRYDQIIIADDRRRKIYATRRDELAALELKTMCSPVPEEFRRIFYDTDWRTEDGKNR